MTLSTTPAVAPSRPFQDAYLYSYSNEHLLYECTQFFWVSNVLSQGAVAQWVPEPDQGTLMINTLLEGFALHLRSVIDFLCPRSSPQSTDITADNFCASGVWRPLVSQFPHSLTTARTRANKEIAHLTSNRSLLSDQNRIWNYIQLTAEITRLLRLFRQHADANRLGDRVIILIDSL
jgi:hypothetical protein